MNSSARSSSVRATGGGKPVVRLIPLLGIALVTVFVAPPLSAQQSWWTTRAVTNGQPADDYAAANVGQLKHFAAAAALEMDLLFSGGAGEPIDGLVGPWLAPPAVGVARDDYAALNLGQLKAVGSLFYSRLGITPPWLGSVSDPDDYALANIGQLKAVFNFELIDADRDGLPDTWEMSQFGDLDEDATYESDGDGIPDLTEIAAGLNPGQPASVPVRTQTLPHTMDPAPSTLRFITLTPAR